MRDYSKVSRQFWTGKTGKALRGNPEAQIVAMYLMTSPHSNMIGVFQLPVLYIAHETGLGMEGALKGLRECIERGFCTYDEASETVFVVEMAAHQVGEELKAGDLRLKGIRKQFNGIAEVAIRTAFFARYGRAYGLEMDAEKRGGIEAPSKPLLSQKQEQEQEQEQEKSKGRASPAGSRLPPDWTLPDDWRAWAETERPDIDPVRESRVFADYWHAVAGAKGRKADWEATWRNWIRRSDGAPRNGSGAPARRRVDL